MTMKKIIALAIAIVTVASIFSATVYAGTSEQAIVEINGTSFSINGGTKQKGYYMLAHNIGSTISVVYKGKDPFSYWQDGNGMTVSTDKSYSFSVLHPVSLTAVTSLEDNDEVSSRVIFFTEYNQTLSSKYYSPSEKITFPKASFRSGKHFVGWDHTDAEIKKEIEAGQSIIRVYPIFESDDSLSVNVFYKSEDSNKSVKSVSIGSGESFSFTAAETYNDKPFAYWIKNDKIISYTRNCSFFVNENTDVYAVYGKVDSEEPAIDINGKVEGNYISLTATRAVDESYTIVEHGIIITTNNEFGHDTPDNRAKADSALVLNGKDVRKTYASTNREYYGDFVINLNTNGKQSTVFAKGYITYSYVENGQTLTDTVYSDMAVVSNVN